MIIKGSIKELMALRVCMDRLCEACGEDLMEDEDFDVEDTNGPISMKFNFKDGIHMEIKEDFVIALYELYSRIGATLLPHLIPIIKLIPDIKIHIEAFTEAWEE